MATPARRAERARGSTQAGIGWAAATLEILILMAAENDPRFDRAAARWVGRLLSETPPMTPKELRWVVAMVEQLPRCRESLHRFAQRR